MLFLWKLLTRLMKDSSQGEKSSLSGNFALILFIIIMGSQLHQAGQLAQLRDLQHPRIFIAAGLDLLVLPVLGSNVHLPRPTDPVGVFVHHLAPVRHPAHASRYCEQHSEHVLRNADRLIDDTRVEIHVGVEFPLDEVVISQGLLFEVDREVQERLRFVVLDGVEHGVAHLLHDGGARVEVFVDTVAEAHQPEVGVLVLGPLDDLGDGGALVEDLFQHVQDRLVGASVVRAPKRANASSYACERVGVRTAGNPDSGSRGILLVLGVADPYDLECPNDFLVDVEVVVHRIGEHHVEEVLHVPEVLLGVDYRQAHGCAIGIGGEGGHFGDELDGHLLPVPRVEQVVIGMQKGRQRPDNSDHNGHGVRLAAEPLVKLNHLLVDHHLPSHHLLKLAELAPRRQLPVQQQVARLHVGRMLSQVLDLVAAVEQLSLLAVDVADVGDAAGRAHEARVVGQQVGLGKQRPHIDQVLTKRPLEYGQFILPVPHLKDGLPFFRLGLDGLHQRQVQLILHHAITIEIQLELTCPYHKNGYTMHHCCGASYSPMLQYPSARLKRQGCRQRYQYLRMRV